MTCYSWYIAAVPHLHHSLTTDNRSCDPRARWPKPLQKSYGLGLLPLVKRFRIRMGGYSTGFAPERLDRHPMRYWSALTNLQELGIDDLQVSSFMPNIHQYFGHFAPTLRFLALRKPSGSSRQLLCFIGLFPNLQDLKIIFGSPQQDKGSTDDEAPLPLSVPPLRGELTLMFFAREDFVRDMIVPFKGLRFRSVDLYAVKPAQLFLDGCAGTLETLRWYPFDPLGEEVFQSG